LVEIAASGFGECEIGRKIRKWLHVGMSEKLGVKSVYAAWTRNSSFILHSLFKVLATVVHSYVDPTDFRGCESPRHQSNAGLAVKAATYTYIVEEHARPAPYWTCCDSSIITNSKRSKTIP